MEKLTDFAFCAAMLSIALMIQAGMITCDAYEYAREKVKGPRHTVK